MVRRRGGAAVSERSSSAQPRVITASPFGRWKYRNVKITRSSGAGYFLAVALTKNGYKKFMKQKSGLQLSMVCWTVFDAHAMCADYIAHRGEEMIRLSVTVTTWMINAW